MIIIIKVIAKQLIRECILGASLSGKILQGKAVKAKTTGQGEIRGS